MGSLRSLHEKRKPLETKFLLKEDSKFIRYLTYRDFQSSVHSSQLPFLIYYFTQYCTLCEHQFLPLKEALSKYNRKINFGSIKGDSRSHLIQSLLDDHRIVRFPCLLLFKGGRIVARIDDFATSSEIEEFLQNNI